VPHAILMDTTGLPYLDACRIIENAGCYGLPSVEEWFFHFLRRFDRVALRIEFTETLMNIDQIEQFLADLTKTGIMAIHGKELVEYELLDVNVEDEFWLYHRHPTKGLVKLCRTEDVYTGEKLPYLPRQRAKEEPPSASQEEVPEPHQNY